MSVIDRVIADVRPYSVVPDDGLATTIRLTLDAIDKGIPGVLVECGTYKGGASFAMLLAQRYSYGEIRRPVHMFDSFEGMGEPSEIDGHHARWWRERSQTVAVDCDGVNYCVCSLEEMLQGAAALGLAEYVVPHKGWYADTLATQKPAQVAVLRVDCDWYEPCRLVYEELVPNVSEGGPVIIDDYCVWEGCTLATHEYLTTHRLPWLVRSAPDQHGAYMHKGPVRW